MIAKSLTPRLWGELILLGVIWGGSFLSIRLILDEVGPLALVFHRVFWAVVVLWGLVWIRGVHVPRDMRIWGAFAVMGLLNNLIPFGLMAWGQLATPVGLTSILNAATAIWGVLIAALFFADEPLTRHRVIGVTIGFLGVVTAIGWGAVAGLKSDSLPQFAVVLGTVSYALAGAWGRRMLGPCDPMIAAVGMLSCSAGMVLPLALWGEGRIDFTLSITAWGAIVYLAIFATALAYLLYYRVLRSAGAGNALLVTLLIPPVSIFLGGYVRSEQLSPNAFLGFAMLAIGLVIMNRWPAEERATRARMARDRRSKTRQCFLGRDLQKRECTEERSARAGSR